MKTELSRFFASCLVLLILLTLPTRTQSQDIRIVFNGQEYIGGAVVNFPCAVGTFNVSVVNYSPGIPVTCRDFDSLPDGWTDVTPGGGFNCNRKVQVTRRGEGLLRFRLLSGTTPITSGINIVRPNPVANVSISGDAFVCTGSKNYSLINLPSSASVTNWSASPGTSVNCTTCNPVTVTPTGGGNGFLVSTVEDIDCGTYTFSKEIRSSVYSPSEMAISGNSSPCTYQQTSYSGPLLSASSSDYSWVIMGGSYGGSASGNVFYLTPYDANYYTVQLRIRNVCGWPSQQASFNFFSQNCGGFRMGGVRSYPNPAKDQISLDGVGENGEDPTGEAAATAPQFEYKLVSGKQKILREGKSSNLKAKIDTKALPRGTYFLQLIWGEKGEQTETRQIVLDK